MCVLDSHLKCLFACLHFDMMSEILLQSEPTFEGGKRTITLVKRSRHLRSKLLGTSTYCLLWVRPKTQNNLFSIRCQAVFSIINVQFHQLPLQQTQTLKPFVEKNAFCHFKVMVQKLNLNPNIMFHAYSSSTKMTWLCWVLNGEGVH